MSIVKDVKSRFRKIFSSSEKPEHKPESKQRMPKVEKYPEAHEGKKDIAKEIFEHTGNIHEGVGQSSTRVERKNVIPQEEPIKKHGLKAKEEKFREKQEAKKENE